MTRFLCSIEELYSLVNTKIFSNPKIRRKERIILELKDKVLLLEGTEQEQLVLNTESTEAASALEVLGYSQKQTSKILSKIIAENPGINVETLIKKALNKL